MPDEADTRAHLDIDAHAVSQLGAQLITDDEQALLELIKNSYDADATWASVKVDSDFTPPQDHDFLGADDTGFIEIADNGMGMDEQSLLKGWLVISVSAKRSSDKKTPSKTYRRYPLGDKGLGRLGTMKLGRSLLVESFTAPDKPGHMVFFRWTDCKSGRPLHEVPVKFRQLPSRGSIGTTVKIYGLNDLSGWKPEKRKKALQTKLSSLICPFEKFRNFTISVTVNRERVELARLDESFRNAAMIRLGLHWDGERLAVSGRLKLEWFRRKQTDDFLNFIQRDRGAALFQYMSKKLKGFDTAYGLSRSSDNAWFLEIDKSFDWADLKNHPDAHVNYSNPGRFEGELDSFDLDASSATDGNLFSSLALYRATVRGLAGVYIYRDNFGVRMPSDWLEFGKEWTTGAGYYSIKPANTIGYIQITVDGNPGMLEKSDREGFIDNEEYQGFLFLCRYFRNFVNETLDKLARSATKFVKEQRGEHPDSSNEPEESERQIPTEVEVLQQAMQRAKELRTRLVATKEKHNRGVVELEAAARRVTWERSLPDKIRQELKGLLAHTEQVVKQLGEDRATVEDIVTELDQQSIIVAKLRRRFEDFTSRSELLYEMVGVGLAAQTLTHDIGTMTTEIVNRVGIIERELKKRVNQIKAEIVIPHLEAIKSTASAIVSTVDLIQPMLRGRREAVETLQASTVVHEFFAQRGERLRNNKILWMVESDPTGDFTFLGNRGRFIQVLDNLLTNSEYWLKQSSPETGGKITIAIEKPQITFWDSGLGVRQDLEDTLFELFVSGKPSKGTGLGLFIVEKLLERDGCSISLSDERNTHGRRYKFVLNLAPLIR
jgi:signal transduction histidine kinase